MSSPAASATPFHPPSQADAYQYDAATQPVLPPHMQHTLPPGHPQHPMHHPHLPPHMQHGGHPGSAGPSRSMSRSNSQNSLQSADSGQTSNYYNQVQVDALREQERLLPIANISRIMKRALPDHAKMSKEAKAAIQECVSEFIGFLTSEASDRLTEDKRKTITGDDVIQSMQALGFDAYMQFLSVYLKRYRQQSQKGGQRTIGLGLNGMKRRKDVNTEKAAPQQQHSPARQTSHGMAPQHHYQQQHPSQQQHPMHQPPHHPHPQSSHLTSPLQGSSNQNLHSYPQQQSHLLAPDHSQQEGMQKRQRSS